jgi:Polyketide cyclase / dehydrase and lipid transport
MLVCRHQTFVPAPARSVWELVGQPNRHSEWWPEIVEVQGTRFGRGCSYCQVSRAEDGVTETTFLVERVEKFRELLVRCSDSGLYMRWLLTEARDGTFVDAEFGIDPERARRSDPGFDHVAVRSELRRSLHSSLDGLANAAGSPAPRTAPTESSGSSSA